MNPKTLTVQWMPFKKEFRVLVKEEALLFTDTDSLAYEIATEEFYKDGG